MEANYNKSYGTRATLYRRARQGWARFSLSGDRDVAESVCWVRDCDRRPGVYLGLPEDGAAGFWHDYAALYAAASLRGVEILERVPVLLPEPGNLSGECGEPGAERPGEGLRPGLGGGEGRFSAARRDFDYR